MKSAYAHFTQLIKRELYSLKHYLYKTRYLNIIIVPLIFLIYAFWIGNPSPHIDSEALINTPYTNAQSINIP